MICLVNGNQEVLILNKVKEIIKCNLEEVNDFTLTHFDAELTSIQDIINDALTLPLGYDKKVVVVKNPFFLLTAKEPRVDFTNDYQILEDYLSSAEETSIIVFYTNSKIDERKQIFKKIKALGIHYLINDVDKTQWFNIAKRQFMEQSVNIKDNDINFFLSRINNDLGQLQQEINKLALYSKNLTREDIIALIPRLLEEKAYLLLDAMVSKDIIHCLSIFYDLKLNNEEPIKIISTIANQLHLQYQVNKLMADRNHEKDIVTELGVHPYQVKLMIGKMHRLTSDRILSMLDKLAALDLKIKTGQADRYQALELFIIQNI